MALKFKLLSSNGEKTILKQEGDYLSLLTNETTEKICFNTSLTSAEVDRIISNANLNYIPGFLNEGSNYVIWFDMSAMFFIVIEDLAYIGNIYAKEELFETGKYFAIYGGSMSEPSVWYCSESIPAELESVLNNYEFADMIPFKEAEKGWSSTILENNTISLTTTSINGFNGVTFGENNNQLKQIVNKGQSESIEWKLSGEYQLKNISIGTEPINLYEDYLKKKEMPLNITLNNKEVVGLIDWEIDNSIEDIIYGQYQNLTQLRSVKLPDNLNVPKLSYWKDGDPIPYAGMFTGCNNIEKIISSVPVPPLYFFINPMELAELQDEELIMKLLSSIGRHFKEIEYTPSVLRFGTTAPSFEVNLFPIKVTFPEGITAFPDFMTENALIEEINIPSTVRSFGESTFSHGYPRVVRFNSDKNLFDITGYYGAHISSGSNKIFIQDEEITTKENWNLQETTKLRYNGIEHYGCNNLTLPATLDEISESFNWQNLGTDNIFVSDENPYFKSVDGILFSKDGKELIRYPKDRTDTSYRIPEGVEKIYQNAFDNTFLQQLILPTTLKFCSKITLNNIQTETYQGLKYLGTEDNPYYFCVNYYGGKTPIHKDVKIIAGIGAGGTYQFYYEGTKEEWYKVRLCFTTYTGANSSIYLYTNQDGNWTRVEELSLEENTEVSDYQFYCNNYLKTIIIPETIESIGKYGFYLATEVQNPQNIDFVKEINDRAFYNCYSWPLTITYSSLLTYIGDYAFWNCDKLEIVLPESLTYIGDYAFSNASLSSSVLHIPKNVEHIGAGAFIDSNIEEFTVDPENQYFSSVNGHLYDKTGTKLICFAPKCPTLEIPEGTTIIGESSCRGNWTNVIIPSTVKEIEKEAFYNGRFQSLKLPRGIEKIGENALTLSYSTNSWIEIPNGVCLEESSIRAGNIFLWSNFSSNWNPYCFYQGNIYWPGQWEYDENNVPKPI